MANANNPHEVISLWYKPRQTMQGLIESGRGHRVALGVAAAFGVVQAVPVYWRPDSAGARVLVLGAVAGFVGLFLFSWLLRNFGRWFGGAGEVRSVRTALGWALLPWWVLFGLLFGLSQTLGPEVVADYYILFFAGFLYGYVILLNALSVALRLTILKTFLVLMVTFLVSLFPLTLLFQLLGFGPPAAY